MIPREKSTRLLSFLLLVYCMALSLSMIAEDDSNSIAKCQQALVSRKVANGEFTEDVLEKALKLPYEQYIDKKEEADVKKLFERLGAEKYEDRESATKELMEKYNAPGYLRFLMEKNKDPEVSGRAKKIIAAWKEKDPGQDFRIRLKMWLNCPSCLAKLKTYREFQELAQKNSKNQLMYDAGRGISLDDFPKDERIAAVVFWMNSCLDRAQMINVSFFRQLKGEEWRNPELLESIRKTLENEGGSFNNREFEEMLWCIPEDTDLKGWLPMLTSNEQRKGAVAALLVKTGNKEALPEFIKLLNLEWTSMTLEKGVVNGGGHSYYYCPFNRFELLEIPAFRKFAPEILKGIEKKFADDRIAIHNSYFNAIRPFVDTEAGMKLLEELASSKYPQTAITASLMLYRQTGKDEVLEKLMSALNAASPQDVINNWAELADLLRNLRGKMLMGQGNPDSLKKYLCEAGGLFMKNILSAPQNYQQKDAMEFIVDELAPFGFATIDREQIIKMLSNYTEFEWWSYPEEAVRFLVQDSKAKGDLKELLQKLEAAAAEPGAKIGTIALLADFSMISGDFSALEKMKDKMQRLMAIVRGMKLQMDGEAEQEVKMCPPQLKKAAWILCPDIFIASAQTFDWGPDYILINEGTAGIAKLAEKLDGQGKPFKAQLFRLSYGLEGADLSKYDEIKEYDAFDTLSGMNWKNPPDKKKVLEKICALSSKLQFSDGYYEARQFVKHIPDLINRFGIDAGEAGNEDPVMLCMKSEMAFRHGDVDGYEKLINSLMKNPSFFMRDSMREDIERQMLIIDLSRGVMGDNVGKVLQRGKRDNRYIELNRFIGLLYENGFVEKARELRKIAPVPDVYWRFEYSNSCLAWAWSEAISGNKDEALLLVETAVLNARSKEMLDYALMIRRLFKEDPADLKGFLEALSLKKYFSRRKEFAAALAKFAESVTHKDLKSLSAFMAARLSLAFGGDGNEARKLWKIGADAGGYHAQYCRDAMNAVGEKEEMFNVSTSWYTRKDYSKEMTPFTSSFGICYKGEKPYLKVDSSEWIGPYGIPFSIDKLQYFCNGSGWWQNIENQSRAWIPGEWSVIIKYGDGIEYHQRTLMPYMASK